MKTLSVKKKLFAIFAPLILSSCAGVPDKPEIDLCSHIKELFIVVCVNNQTNEVTEISIEATDRWVMMSPNDWGKVLFYTQLLERNISSKNNKSRTNYYVIQRELNKILTTAEKLNTVY